MYGITYGNAKVQKWVTSLIVSIFSSVFLTSPIQLTLTAVFMATIFRKKTDLFQDKVKEDARIDNSVTMNENSMVNYGKSEQAIPVHELVKKKRMTEKKIKETLKRVFVHAIFLTFLFITAVSVRNVNSFNYQAALQNLFIDGSLVRLLKLYFYIRLPLI
jgi:hypothetical protein